ncbi:MAG: hypothetical protein ACXVP7_08435 [Actinomycetota bacterium]
MGHQDGTKDALHELRIAVAEMRMRKALANPAVRVHAERYLENAESAIEYLAALLDRSSVIGQDDVRERLALDRAVRAVRFAEAKLDAAIAEERGDRQAEAEANRHAAEIVTHLGDEEDEDGPPKG